MYSTFNNKNYLVEDICRIGCLSVSKALGTKSKHVAAVAVMIIAIVNTGLYPNKSPRKPTR